MIFRLTGHCSLDNDGVEGLSRHCDFDNDGVGGLSRHCDFDNDGVGGLSRHCDFDNDGVGGLSRHCEVHNAQQRSPLPATSSHEQRRTADPHPQQQKTGRISCARPHLTILFILSLCFWQFHRKRGAGTFHTFHIYFPVVGFD